MKRFKTVLWALALAACATAAQAIPALILSPALSNALVGDLIAIEVRGQGFNEAVVGGGFDLSFNPAVVSLDSVEIDVAEWELVSDPGTIDNVAGTLTAVWFNAFAAPLPTGSFPIATLRFTALAAGQAALNLTGNADFPFVSDAAQVITVGLGRGGITVNAVPEPEGTAGLVLGLALLPWLRRRRAVS